MRLTKEQLAQIETDIEKEQTAEALKRTMVELLRHIAVLLEEIEALESKKLPPSHWMTREEAAHYRRCHVDTIDKNRVPWTDSPPKPGMMRYKILLVGSTRSPRLWREDVINSGFLIPGKDRGI